MEPRKCQWCQNNVEFDEDAMMWVHKLPVKHDAFGHTPEPTDLPEAAGNDDI